eukprot:COSAG04_NODE_10458_length_775_cov_2.770710_2_plen_80_part_01
MVVLTPRDELAHERRVGSVGRQLQLLQLHIAHTCPRDSVDPLVGTWRVERRGEFSPLGPLASCFLALGFSLGLVGTVSAR